MTFLNIFPTAAVENAKQRVTPECPPCFGSAIVAKHHPGVSDEPLVMKRQPELAPVFPGSVRRYSVDDIEELPQRLLGQPPLQNIRDIIQADPRGVIDPGIAETS